MAGTLVDGTAAAVGIECFCSPHEAGFSGIIKARPEDFCVQEVSEDGTVVDLSPGDEKDVVLAAPPSAPAKIKKSIETSEPEEGWRAFLDTTLGPNVVDAIAGIVTSHETLVRIPAPGDLSDKVKLLHAIQHCFPGVQSDNAKDDHGAAVLALSLDPLFAKLRQGGMAGDDCNRVLAFLLRGPLAATADDGVALVHAQTKEARTKMHRLISSSTSSLVTKTTATGGVHVSFSPKTLQKQRKRKQDTFVRCTLQKVRLPSSVRHASSVRYASSLQTNVDHFSALDVLARAFRAAVADLSVAGTKDKRAVTHQHVVVKNVTPETIRGVAGQLHSAGLAVGGLQYVDRPLSLGQTRGNRCEVNLDSTDPPPTCRFTIRIRNVDAPASLVGDAVASVHATGCLNYFGVQRVGHPGVPVRSHHIGQAMLQQKWDDVVRLLFSQTQLHDVNLTAKQAFLETRDIGQALKDLPDKCATERAVLMGLRRFGPSEAKKAVLQIPYHRRVMYLHAYQSYVFNRMVSHRMRAHGASVVLAGDLVQDPETKQIRVVDRPEDEDMANVVLPLVGTKIQYPANDVGAHYAAILRDDDVDVASWCQDATVKGAYRHVLCRAAHLTWHADGEKDIIVAFQLPPGSFATVFLRELMKASPTEQPSDDVQASPLSTLA
ncbi:Aste57867_11043 [Aphanomyces stellatus]|uniref:Aste57867_11043 protein n=1 Tax=Aphanomyces stellatus TaxID=120398 RepID=A0A485KSG0_9STRA|nr:hypothetical protein As57867_011001 [Aphanomyces stellatus]VFT87911.1 Aste57867_11043 [Aphanomyces stellatus]